MEWLILIVLVGVIAAAGWAMSRDRAAPSPDGDFLAVLGDDGLEIDNRLETVASEDLDALRDVVVRRLEALHDRSTPLRAIQPTPWDGVGRLVFADGTYLLARSATSGDLTAVALLRSRGAVLVVGHSPDPRGVTVELAGPGGATATVVVIGLDQPAG